eukprot:s5945_g1.t1
MQMQMMQPMQPMQPRLVLRQAALRQPVVDDAADAADAATLGAAAGRAQAASGAVACAASAAMAWAATAAAWSVEARDCGAHGDASDDANAHREAHGEACGEANAVVRVGLPHCARNQQNIIVVDLRGQDRASGTISGTVPIPAMDFLKEIQKYVEEFRDTPIMAFFCQYSAHRAPSVANFYRKSCPSKQRVLVLEGLGLVALRLGPEEMAAEDDL